jgi:hypothetical protein
MESGDVCQEIRGVGSAMELSDDVVVWLMSCAAWQAGNKCGGTVLYETRVRMHALS